MRLCNCIFTLSRQSRADSPRSVRRQTGSAAYFKGDKTQSYIVLHYFSLRLARPPPSTSYSIPALRGSAVFTSRLSTASSNCSVRSLDDDCVLSVEALEEVYCVSYSICGCAAAQTQCSQPGGQHYSNAGSAFLENVIYLPFRCQISFMKMIYEALMIT